MSNDAIRLYARKQLALRQMLLNGRGELTANAKVIVADLRKFCHADGRPMLKYNPATGMLDDKATIAAAARREVFDRLERMLLVDRIHILTASEED